MASKLLRPPIKGLLLDITGVLKDGDSAIQGSVEAVRRLQEAKIPFRLVTNESLIPRRIIKERLNRLGFKITGRDMFSPVPALIEVLKNENLRPHLLLHELMMEEFEGIDTSDPNCVVIGDAEDFFTYENLNSCFRRLLDMTPPILISLGMGKYYKDGDDLCLDVGSYAKGLEYATGCKARVVGKPSSNFFLTAVNDLGLFPDEVVMIGDDIEGDVGGAQKSGIRGVLVRTGKYRPTDEKHPTVKPDAVVDNLEEAVNMILKKQ